jgi:hypothetical protein
VQCNGRPFGAPVSFCLLFCLEFGLVDFDEQIAGELLRFFAEKLEARTHQFRTGRSVDSPRTSNARCGRMRRNGDARVTMALDSLTLDIVATMVAALLGAMLLLLGREVNTPALRWWGAAYLLGSASVAIWTLIGSRFGDFVPLLLSAAGLIACGTRRASFTARSRIWSGCCSVPSSGSRPASCSARMPRRSG